jgi:hypothetical protein
MLNPECVWHEKCTAVEVVHGSTRRCPGNGFFDETDDGEVHSMKKLTTVLLVLAIFSVLTSGDVWARGGQGGGGQRGMRSGSRNGQGGSAMGNGNMQGMMQQQRMMLQQRVMQQQRMMLQQRLRDGSCGGQVSSSQAQMTRQQLSSGQGQTQMRQQRLQDGSGQGQMKRKGQARSGNRGSGRGR